jgi:uracil-DNA glycosylase
MSKKVINQKTNYDSELLNSIDANFFFNEKPINRLKNDYSYTKIELAKKTEALDHLRNEINSIEDCSLKNNSKKIVLGDGNINSPIMIVGEAPETKEDNLGTTFMGEAGNLLKKMLIAIDIKKENVYSTYAVNFRPPEDRKPTSSEIKRYSLYLQKHISIIKPKMIILMGSTAMEALTGLKSKISVERGQWKEIIVKNITYNVMITFNPSYLLRAAENKKYSWEDLKKIKQKIKDLNLII